MLWEGTMDLTGIRGCHWDSTIEGPLSELFLGKGLSVITPSRWKAVRGCLKEGYVQHWGSFYLFFLPLHKNVTTLLFKQKLCRFLLPSPAAPSITHFQTEGKAGPPLWRVLQKYGDEGSSPAHGYGAALTPALLLLPDPSGTGCSFSTVRGPAGQLHWILRIPAWKKGCRTAGSIKALLLQGASLGNRFPGYIGLCLWDFPYHVI